jgi:alkylation response protein AidB-like acyl-CoA dehydrogenase
MIDLLPNDEQRMIIDAAMSFLSERPSKAHFDPEYDYAVTREMAELGWLGLGLDADMGGVGYTITEEVLLFRESGRHLGSISLLAGSLAARIAALSGMTPLASEILEGDVIIGLGRPLERSPSLESRGNAFHLAGAEHAQLIVMFDRQMAYLWRREDFKEFVATPAIDSTVTLERAALSARTPVASLSAAMDPIFWRATLLASAMQVGMAEATRDMAVEYAKLRKQFGREIGAFQAIKHMCADMAVRAEASLSLTALAAVTWTNAPSTRYAEAAAANIVAVDAAMTNAEANIQVHGGIGFHAECRAHLYLKRVQLLDYMIGRSRIHNRTMLETMGAHESV